MLAMRQHVNASRGKGISHKELQKHMMPGIRTAGVLQDVIVRPS